MPAWMWSVRLSERIHMSCISLESINFETVAICEKTYQFDIKIKSDYLWGQFFLCKGTGALAARGPVEGCLITCDVLICSCQLNLVHQGHLGLARGSSDYQNETWLTQLCLSPDFNSWHFWTNCGFSRPSFTVHLSGISGTVHHDTPPIKGSTMSPTGLPSEVALLAKNDIFKDNFYISISVWPHHLVDSTCRIGIT